jgi:phage terminase large subunit-like protein
MKAGREALEQLLSASPEEAAAILQAMDEAAVRRFHGDWGAWAREGQEPPDGDWRVWVMMAGRGFGKTRAGAEWVCAEARSRPRARIALVAATVDEARRVMVEGRSGICAIAGDKVLWQPSRGRLEWENGAKAFVYSGGHGEGLRGPEHHLAWCDELSKWAEAESAWSNLMLGLRLGPTPRALVTTTPKAGRALRAVLDGPDTVLTRGRMADNPFLPPSFVSAMEREIGGTRLGRQELDGELIEEAEGALWPRELIEASRQSGALTREYKRVVIGVDPPAGVGGDACGIVAVGLDAGGLACVIGDHSVGGLSPEGWARKVAAAAELHRAERIVAEANNGGRMVESVLRGAGIGLPVKLVHAAEGKVARAAPVAALFESGQAKFAGRFPALEDELAGLSWNGGYQGPGRSPDRADAMVWAMSALMLGSHGPPPAVRSF